MAKAKEGTEEKNTMKYTTPGQIQARRDEILEEQKSLAKELKTLRTNEKEVARRQDSNRVAIIGRFIKNEMPEQYEKILKMSKFNEYLNRDIDRALFGFPSLGKSGTNTPKPEPKGGDRLYVTMTVKDAPDAKKLAEEVFGENWKGLFKWDKGAARWYLRGDGIARAGAFSKYMPHDLVPAPGSTAVTEGGKNGLL